MGEIRLFYKYILNECHKFKIIKKEDGHSDQEISPSYYRFQKSFKEFVPTDVSSAIGLFREKYQTITLKENEQLERCLADLLLYFLYPHLNKETGTKILIQGPPLPKLIGRIGYRYPCPDLTIAFVTVDDRYFSPPTFGPFPNSEWDGPFPDLQDDSLIRRFYNIEEKIRVDLFAQGLNHFNASHIENDIPCGIRAKLENASGAIIRFSREIREWMEPSREDKESTPIKEGLPKELEPGLRLAAQSPQRNVQDPETPIKTGTNQHINLSDDETYYAIFKDKHLKTGQKRFDELSTFFSNGELGKFCERIHFLRFIKKTLEHHSYPMSWVFSQNDLNRWFREEEGPEDFGSR